MMDKTGKAKQKKVSDTCCMTRTTTLTTSQARRRLKTVPQQPSETENSSKSFPFLKLSAELRNAIYELCLVTERTIHVKRTTDFMVWRGKHCVKERPSAWCPESEYSPLAVSPNLLVTCRTINEEATPILYGSNHFALQPDFSFQLSHLNGSSGPWTECIGGSVKHIRKIVVRDAVNQSHMSDLLEVLKKAKHLEKWGVQFSENFPTSRTMAKALWPLLLELHLSRKGTDQKAALDVFDFDDKKSSTSSTSSTVDTDEVKGIIEEKLTAFDRASSRKK